MATAKVARLELRNFKSYYGETTVGPFHDFTCIVGPNGAGKSNLMDALSFVLGSQASALRGEKATDLINRKAKRKEGCSVTLVLQPTAGGRPKALMRSVNGTNGEIEVRVDGVLVTQKEFQEVLKAHRIGSRINTFLVFQNEVEAVAQKKAREMTELLEEVSGSAKLKGEYLAAKKTLEQANDLLSTASLEKRGAQNEVQQMKLQKKEAEKYDDILNSLNQERRDLALVELFSIESSLTKEKEELENKRRKFEQLKKEAMDIDIQKRKQEFSDLHKKYVEFLKQNREKTNTLREKKATLDQITGSIKHYEQKMKREEGDRTAAEKVGKQSSAETTRLKEQLDQQKQLLATLEDEWAAEDRKAAAARKISPDDEKERKKLRAEADIQTLTLRQELETNQRKRDSLLQSKRSIENAIGNAEAAQRDAVNGAQRAEENLRQTEAAKAEHQEAHGQLKADAVAANGAVKQLEHAALSLTESIQKIEAKLREQRAQRDNDRATARAKEAFNDLKRLHPGVRGRLVDLCTPKPEYQVAATVVMGKWMDAIVVDTTETAIACVNYLKHNKISPMNFIPLDSCKGKAVDDSQRTIGGTVRPIFDVIEVADDSIKKALQFAVGQTLVCDRLDEAYKVAYPKHSDVRHKVVTKDGTICQKNGAVQGGLASVQDRSAKWKEKEYEGLKAERERLEKERGPDSKVVQARSEAKRLESELHQAENRLKEDMNRIDKLKADARKFHDDDKKAAAEIGALQKKLSDVNRQMADVEKEQQKRQDKVSAVEQTIFKDFIKRTGLTSIAEVDKAERAVHRNRIEQRQHLTLLINKLETAMNAAAKQRTGVRSAEEVAKSLEDTKKQLQTCQHDVKNYQRSMEAARNEQEAAQKRVNEARARLDKLEEEIRTATKRSGTQLSEAAIARKHVAALEAKCNHLRQQRLSLFQRTVLEEIDLPTMSAAEASSAVGRKRGRSEDNDDDDDDDLRVPAVRLSEAFTSFTEGTEASSPRRAGRLSTGGKIAIDFSDIASELRKIATDTAIFAKFKKQTEAKMGQLERELDSIAPNLKAKEKFSSTEQKALTSSTNVDQARENQRKALAAFTRVKDRRVQLFNDAFEKIQTNVDRVYRELTQGTRAADVHGQAYLTLDDTEEPFNGGTRYTATPPMKRFVEMDALSGGERTMAALALLFAIHQTSPTPFFVLDEVDAALDIGNVLKLAHYMRTHTSNCQFLVVSLKEQLYHTADSLLGVHKDTVRDSSGTLTFDLRRYKE